VTFYIYARAKSESKGSEVVVVVLVIEDEPGIADFLRRGLESAGFVVAMAADGQLGLLSAQRDEVELVILDLGLPGLPGEQVLRRLRAVRPALPVIVLTAKDAVADRVANLDAGADDYVSSRSASPSCSPGSAYACGNRTSPLLWSWRRVD
jgi:CheY-like chemotaxis protein